LFVDFGGDLLGKFPQTALKPYIDGMENDTPEE
jgi:hypothetical protein